MHLYELLACFALMLCFLSFGFGFRVLLYVPHHWLQAKIAMMYKSGPFETARSYRPIYVATGMYSILARHTRAHRPGTLRPPSTK